MKPKILTFMSGEKGHAFFGILNSLQEKIDIENYVIIDRNPSVKPFFSEQEFVNFKKIYFYRDFVAPENSPDLEYLIDFEQRTKINLLITAFADPALFRQDNYEIQSQQVILSLLSDTCKLFEKIISENKPDFLIIHWGGTIQINLLESIAKFYGVKVLKFSLGNFGSTWQITQNFELIDNYGDINLAKLPSLTLSYLEEQRKNLDMKKQYIDILSKGAELKKINFIKNFIYNLTKLQDEFKSQPGNSKKKYSKFLFQLLKENIFHFSRKRFLDRHALKNFVPSKNFVYFPLHVQPESTIDYSAPFSTKQISVIKNLSQSLPVNYELYVKEHFSMGIWSNWRDTSYYKEILDMPNVKLIHPSVSSSFLMERCALVTTIHGSASYEALFYHKPVILLTEMTTSTIIPSVIQVNDLEELPITIRNILKHATGDGYVEFFESKMRQTFTFDISIFSDTFKLFYKNAMIEEISIPVMQKYLNKHKITLQFLSKKFIDKIKDHQEGKILS
jgi:hypothetical protein